MTSLYDEIFKRFNTRITKGNEIEAFAIMPNHLHLLIFVKKQTTSICAGKWKAFSASSAWLD
jgi:REP element-mobilizing transposase RayT